MVYREIGGPFLGASTLTVCCWDIWGPEQRSLTEIAMLKLGRILCLELPCERSDSWRKLVGNLATLCFLLLFPYTTRATRENEDGLPGFWQEDGDGPGKNQLRPFCPKIR